MPVTKSGVPDIGYNTDAAGTRTVFARLKQIVDNYLADDSIGLAVLLSGIGINQMDLDSILADIGDASESTLGNLLGILGNPSTSLSEWIESLYIDSSHLNYLFPEDSDETGTFTAGGPNDFGAWAEIVDNNAVTLSSKATSDMHISSIIAEDASEKDKVYVMEISYGDDKTIVARARMLSATNKIGHTYQERMRNLIIPAGETIYYRMKCETGQATAVFHFRYHYH